MSTENFDDLAAALANRSISRRRALQVAAASVLGAVGLGVGAREAQAAPMCPPRGTHCERQCINTQKDCRCIRTIAGNRRCVHPCCSPRTCEANSDCRPTEVCMRTACCGPEPTCVTLCKERRPDYGGCDEPDTATQSTGSWLPG